MCHSTKEAPELCKGPSPRSCLLLVGIQTLLSSPYGQPASYPELQGSHYYSDAQTSTRMGAGEEEEEQKGRALIICVKAPVCAMTYKALPGPLPPLPTPHSAPSLPATLTPLLFLGSLPRRLISQLSTCLLSSASSTILVKIYLAKFYVHFSWFTLSSY